MRNRPFFGLLRIIFIKNYPPIAYMKHAENQSVINNTKSITF